MMNEVTKLYRYESSIDDKLKLLSFDVIKETDKGYWIETSYSKKWIKKNARKKYAYESPKLALHNFIKRYEKYLSILENKIGSVNLLLNGAYYLFETNLDKNNHVTELPKYLVRPHDYSIFTLNPENNEYYLDLGNGHTTMSYTYDLLVNTHHFYPAEECELKLYEEKNIEYLNFESWKSRSDGHGGCKGGTYKEYLKHKEDIKKYTKWLSNYEY